MAKRGTLTAAFKTTVVKEAPRGDQTVQRIATRHELHPARAIAVAHNIAQAISDQVTLHSG